MAAALAVAVSVAVAVVLAVAVAVAMAEEVILAIPVPVAARLAVAVATAVAKPKTTPRCSQTPPDGFGCIWISLETKCSTNTDVIFTNSTRSLPSMQKTLSMTRASHKHMGDPYRGIVASTSALCRHQVAIA